VGSKGWAEPRDVRFMRDMHKEMEREVAMREDPALAPMLCKCGHRLSEHYQGTMAMPCGKCACMRCTAPRAEDIRRQKARLGVKDITPHPEFERRRGK